MRKTLALLGLALCFPLLSVAGGKPAVNPCPGPIGSETDPAPVDQERLLSTLRDLRTTANAPVLEIDNALRKDIHDVFDLVSVKTKMEQFYRLLYVIQARAKPDLGAIFDLNPGAGPGILTTVGVFSDSQVPGAITSVRIDRTKKTEPRYSIGFAGDSVRFPLNKGKGFYGWENGRCQLSKALIFYRKLSFSLCLLPNGNLAARYFDGVDLYGDFGTRGLIDVDLNYIALSSVEFYRGTKTGEVSARVSQEEFRKNDHNPFLRIITKFVRNTSVQPIDW